MWRKAERWETPAQELSGRLVWLAGRETRERVGYRGPRGEAGENMKMP